MLLYPYLAVYLPYRTQQLRHVEDVGLVGVCQRPTSIQQGGQQGTLHQDHLPAQSGHPQLKEEGVGYVDGQGGEDEELQSFVLEGPEELCREEEGDGHEYVVEGERYFLFLLVDAVLDCLVLPAVAGRLLFHY